MAVIWGASWDLGTVAIGFEHRTGSNGSPAHETTEAITGTGSIRLNNASVAEYMSQVVAAAQGVRFYQVWFKLKASANTDAQQFINVANSSNRKVAFRIRNSANGNKLQFYNDEDGTQIGSDSSSLSLDTIYILEWKIDSTTLASTAVEARLYTPSNRTAFWNPSATIDITADPNRLNFGWTVTDTTLDVIFDNMLVWNNSGSYMNDWGGGWELIILSPDGPSSAAWARGGTDSGNNWDQCNEIPPNDVTDYVQSNTSGQIDKYTLTATPAALESTDVIGCIAVSCRFSTSSLTGADPDYKLGVDVGGTTDYTGNLNGTGSTAWVSLCSADILWSAALLDNSSNYEQPGTATAYDKTALDSMLVAIQETVTDTHYIRISSLWVYVVHKPSAGATVSCGAAVLASAGPAATVVPGAVTVAGTVAVLASAGPQASVYISTFIPCLAAVLASAGPAATVVPGAVTITALAGVLASAGRASTVVPGEVTITALAGVLASAGQASTVAATFNLPCAVGPIVGAGAQATVFTTTAEVIPAFAGVLASAGQASTVVPGAVTITAAVGPIAAAGYTFTVFAPPNETVAAFAGVLASAGLSAAVVPGAVAVAGAAGVLASAGQAATVSYISTVSIPVLVAVLASYGWPSTIRRGGAPLSRYSGALTVGLLERKAAIIPELRVLRSYERPDFIPLSDAVPVSVVNAVGDLIAGSGDSSVGRLPVGTNGQFLTTATGQSLKTAWANPPADAGTITLTNKSGAQVNPGTLVVLDFGSASAFTTSTIEGDRRVLGVTLETIANNATGKIALGPSAATVLVSGAVAAGDVLIQSTVAGQAKASGRIWRPGYVGVALESGSGSVRAMINPERFRSHPGPQTVSLQTDTATGGGNISITVDLGAASGEKLILYFCGEDTGFGATPTLGGVSMTLLHGEGAGLLSLYKAVSTDTGTKALAHTGLDGASIACALVLSGHNTSSPHGTSVRKTESNKFPNSYCSDAAPGDLVIWGAYSYVDLNSNWLRWGPEQKIELANLVESGRTLVVTSKHAQQAQETSYMETTGSNSCSSIAIPVHSA